MPQKNEFRKGKPRAEY